jgi:hypothetical protein
VNRLNLNEALCEALFASPLQPSDAVTAEAVTDAIGSTVRRLGAAGCADRMAQEFGDHPVEAQDRMSWVRALASELCGCMFFPTVAAPADVPAGADLLPVREAA